MLRTAALALALLSVVVTLPDQGPVDSPVSTADAYEIHIHRGIPIVSCDQWQNAGNYCKAYYYQ